MPRITEECVARIKDAADIVAVVSHYVQLRRAGTAWKACCPFHSEKTPSFHVNPARQTFHCFGCGEGGDAVKFIMRYDNLDYPTALRRLADMAGVPVIEEEENPEIARQRRLRGRIIELNALAADYYHRLLCRSKEAAHVREYLKSRNINIAIAKEWGLGWAPPDFRQLRQLAESRGMDTRLLTEAYLLGKGSSGLYPVFTDRLMFPIFNVRREVVGFSGRVMQAEKDPRKYVNTAETAAFRKGELLFGLYKATKGIAQAGMCVVICEGQLDVITCHELADVRNAVAGLGTAFTEEHARKLAKYAKKAILCYDGDQAGIKACEKTFRKLVQAGLEVYQAVLPPGEDPDSLIRSQGAAALQQAIAEARPYLEVRVSQELSRCRGDLSATSALVPQMADLAAEIPNDARREIAVMDMATRLNLGLDTFRTTVAELRHDRKKQPRAASAYTQESYEEEPLPGSYGGAYDAAPGAPHARIIPITLHSTIRALIITVRNSEAGRNALLERVEELQEPIRYLSGGVILQRLLERLPAVGDTEAWAQFVQELPPEQALALRNIDDTPIPDEVVEAHVNDTCARAAEDTIKAKMDRLHARLRNAEIGREEYLHLLDEVSKLNKFVSATAPMPAKRS